MEAAGKGIESRADRTRELLAKMFPAERPLTDLERAQGALRDARDRLAHLPRTSNAMLGLIQLVSGRDDLTPELREVFRTNHRIGEAQAAIAKATGGQ